MKSKILFGLSIGLIIGSVVRSVLFVAGVLPNNPEQTIIAYLAVFLGIITLFLAAIARNQEKLMDILRQNSPGGSVPDQTPTHQK